MTFQTQQNNGNNRDKNSPEELSDEICSIWQEITNLFQTFTEVDDRKDRQSNTNDARELLRDEDQE